MNPNIVRPAFPWWRAPAAWLVFALPAFAVVASLALVVFAWRDGDVPLLKTVAPGADAMTPATQARNHVVTPR